MDGNFDTDPRLLMAFKNLKFQKELISFFFYGLTRIIHLLQDVYILSILCNYHYEDTAQVLVHLIHPSQYGKCQDFICY